MSFPCRSIKTSLKCNNKCMVLNMSNRSPDFKQSINMIETNSFICDNIHNCEDVVEQARQTELINIQENIENQRKVELFRKEVRQRVRNIEKMKRLKQEVQQKAIEAEQNMYGKKASDSADVMLGIIKAHPITSHGDNKRKVKENKVNSDDFETQQLKVRENCSTARRNLLSLNPSRDPSVASDVGLGDAGDDMNTKSSGKAVHNYAIDTELHVENYSKTTYPELKQMNIDEKKNSLTLNKKKKKKNKSAASKLSHVTVNTRIVDVNPGAVDEASKRAAQTQRALYRRHFMNIERNQIKQVSEKAEENKRIDLLKRDKEKERMELEELTEKFAKVKQFEHPVNNNASIEAKRKSEKKAKSEKMKMKKIENQRYLDALKQQLKDKVKNCGMELPSLCGCWPDIWSMDTDLCANNCIFYKNPKEYEAILKSMMISCNIY